VACYAQSLIGVLRFNDLVMAGSLECRA
jgi:hypothetical protein